FTSTSKFHTLSLHDALPICRMFKMWQCCGLDDSDNYRANCMSDIKWGEISAYKALVDCKNDKELFEAAIGVFKHLYPETKVVKRSEEHTSELQSRENLVCRL